MSWGEALGAGAGLGLVYFGGLWLTVHRIVQGTRGKGLLLLSWLARLTLAALVFAALAREGPGAVLAGLGGLVLARRCLVGRLGGVSRGT